MLRDAGDGRRGRPAFPGRRWRWLGLLPALAGCAGPGAPAVPASRSAALTLMLPPASDTFVNSHNPDNNNGASLSLFTGRDGMDGVMRALIRFDLPAALQGRVTVTGVQLTLTTRGLGASETIAGTMATESLQAVSEDWTAGNGAGNAQMQFVVGEPCGGSVMGATWNQPRCGVAATGWMTAGGSVAAAISGQAVAPPAPDSPVIWDAALAGNAGMIADLQGWVDTPASNHGWRITSSTEAGAPAQAQRFYAAEAPINAPGLALSYDCKPGFVASGNDGGLACIDQDECLPNHCRDAGDLGANCTDKVAPATGYDCACSAGFTFAATTCVRNGVGGAPGTGGAAGGTGGATGSDGGRDSGTPTNPGSSGCSCALASGGAAPIVILFAAGALLPVVRRRRRRCRRAT